MPSTRMLVIAVWFGCLAAGGGAWAQPSDSNVYFDAPGLLPKKSKAGAPDVKPQPTVWPRLDPGAVFCKSQDDLGRLAARRGGEDVAGPIDCQVVRVPTGVSILHRAGPGEVEVQTSNPRAGGIGWTDAWLPDKIPPGKGVVSNASAGR